MARSSRRVETGKRGLGISKEPLEKWSGLSHPASKKSEQLKEDRIGREADIFDRCDELLDSKYSVTEPYHQNTQLPKGQHANNELSSAPGGIGPRSRLRLADRFDLNQNPDTGAACTQTVDTSELLVRDGPSSRVL